MMFSIKATRNVCVGFAFIQKSVEKGKSRAVHINRLDDKENARPR